MTTPTPSSNNPSGSQPKSGIGQSSTQGGSQGSQTGRQDANQGQGARQTQSSPSQGSQAQGSQARGSQDQGSQASGPQESASRSFKNYGSESASSRGNPQDIERYLNAIEENCRGLRQALGSSSSSEIGRSDISESSRTSSGRESGRDTGRASTSR